MILLYNTLTTYYLQIKETVLQRGYLTNNMTDSSVNPFTVSPTLSRAGMHSAFLPTPVASGQSEGPAAPALTHRSVRQGPGDQRPPSAWQSRAALLHPARVPHISAALHMVHQETK